ncbi:MAG: HAMP domain-containing histidine kinase [Rikenellaceae bacterium]|nr:HAMP domain-containing histidine kinase [Rikenellaceae bacterium]
MNAPKSQISQSFFRRISVVVIASLVLLAVVQCFWGWRMYRNQVEDFERRVESATYKSIYKAFRMDAIPGLVAAEQIKINLDEFAFYFEPNLLELDALQPYAAEVLDLTASSRVMMHRGDAAAIRNPMVTLIEIDDDAMFGLRLTIEVPHRAFFGQMWGLLASSVVIVLLLSVVLIYLIRTMFRQRTIEQMRRDFTHNITHELKTPISVAVAATDAMRNFSADADIERRSRYLEIVEAQLSQLTAMVERILTVSVEGRQAKLSIEQVALREAFEQIVEGVQIGGDEDATLSIDCDEQLLVTADPHHLKSVVMTLIDNALKYGGRPIAITLTATKVDSTTEIRVADNGCGIAREHLAHLFEKFYRVPSGDVQRPRGYGLGLYYARQVIEAHGGQISAESRTGHGTTIIIKLPDNEQ